MNVAPALSTPTYVRLREQLRQDIVAGVWPLGTHVTLHELARHYQVSANPVREALLQLQGEGVIAMRMNRGAVIPTVDARYIDNLYKVRGAIQSMLAREAARRATPSQVKTLMSCVEAFEQAAKHPDRPGPIVEANRRLHRCIDAMADNPIAAELLAGREALVDGFRRAIGYVPERLDEIARQHRTIADAIAAGDEQAAASATFEHTEASRLHLLALCNAQPA